MDRLEWSKAFPGIWQTTVGQPDRFTPLSVAAQTPAEATLKSMGDAALPVPLEAIRYEPASRQIVVTLPLVKDEKIYGFGLQFLSFNQRGKARTLRVNSDPRVDSGETHAPVPFYVSSQGYGLLVNTARVITIQPGSARRVNPQDPAGEPLDLIELLLPPEGAEIFLFAGPRMLDAVRRYNLFCGGGALPPRWGLGIWHRANHDYNDRQVLDEVEEYRKHGLPLDVVGLEPGWQTHAYPCTYEWSPERFPDPAGFVRRTADLRLRVNLWEHAYVSPQSPLYNAVQPYAGSHLTMGGLVPDFSLPEPNQIFQEQHERQHLGLGISGYKLDECDGGDLCEIPWSFPAHAVYPSGRDGESIRQVYGLMLQKMITDLFHRRDQRTYGLVRASNAGASALPFVLYSDLYNHRQFVRALCNSTFCGLLWTPEVRDAVSAEDFIRRIQLMCFSPMAQLDAWATSVMPWSYPEIEPIVRKYLDLRLRLLPYFYSAFARYHFDGTPPFRAMALDVADPASPAAAAGLTADDQYMAGDSLLVAPVLSGETSRLVYFPEGYWYDFETGEAYPGGQVTRIFTSLDRLPLFVRDGGIIPLMPSRLHAPTIGEVTPLEIRCYGKAPGSFRLYDDDGETYAYEHGEYRWIDLSVTPGAGGTLSPKVSSSDPSWKSSYGEITWVYKGEPTGS